MHPESVAENLHRITVTGYKMRDIIDELLLFARVRQIDTLEIGPLDTGAIIAEVLASLALRIQETQAEIVMPEIWPVASGYAAWVEIVWSNMISNAIKYGGDPASNVPPYIELGFTTSSTASSISNFPSSLSNPPIPDPQSLITFWIRDNGPGLLPEECVQLFTPFTRFHQEKAEGHGLGLCIVQRIVEKLGGQVGVESAGVPGKGCTFWFTLPES